MANPSGPERRRWPRRASAECPWLLEAKLRSGTEVRVVDISNGGLLLESSTQILPGARVELFLLTRDHRWLVKGQVLRCRVSRVVKEDGVRYHAALIFNEPLAILEETGKDGELRAVATDLRPPRGRIRAFAVPAPAIAGQPPLEAAS